MSPTPFPLSDTLTSLPLAYAKNASASGPLHVLFRTHRAPQLSTQPSLSFPSSTFRGRPCSEALSDPTVKVHTPPTSCPSSLLTSSPQLTSLSVLGYGSDLSPLAGSLCGSWHRVGATAPPPLWQPRQRHGSRLPAPPGWPPLSSLIRS